MRCFVTVVPEAGKLGLVDAGTCNDNVRRSAALLRNEIDEVLKMVTGSHIGGLEENLRTNSLLCRLQPLCRLAGEHNISDEDGTATCVYGPCEGEVDTYIEVLIRVGKLRDRRWIGDCFA